jgi:Holliday junction resolvasome RuvABC ATP-dependent DNA helicase subunit
LPRKPDYTGISIKEEFAGSIEQFIDAHPELGYRSIAQFLEDSARRRLEELQAQIKEPRFEQINIDENGTKILDRKIHEVIQVYIKPQGIKCGLDQTSDCEHINFALTLKDVRETIRRHKKEGWKLPDV